MNELFPGTLSQLDNITISWVDLTARAIQAETERLRQVKINDNNKKGV